jgi:hypothetical protein
VESVANFAIVVLMVSHMCSAVSAAKDLPDAPSATVAVSSSTVSAPALVVAPKPTGTTRVDTKFVSLTIISTGSAFADSYTTLFARENWLAGKKGVCNIEVESAYLYGTHPTVARSYAVASVKSVTAVAAALYLRKHHRKWWSFPLAANAVISLQGVTQNMITCN